jgi:hypothetical protein
MTAARLQQETPHSSIILAKAFSLLAEYKQVTNNLPFLSISHELQNFRDEHA